MTGSEEGKGDPLSSSQPTPAGSTSYLSQGNPNTTATPTTHPTTPTVTTTDTSTKAPAVPEAPTRYLKFTPMDELSFSDDDGTQSYPLQVPKHQFPEVIVSPGVARVSYGIYPGKVPNEGHDRNAVSAPDGRDEPFNKVPSPPVVSVGAVTVRAEEIALVLVVLMLWAGAITLFINRWGKLRMLEPYQPAYTAPSPPPRPPPPQVGPCINIQSTSDLTGCDLGSTSRFDWGPAEMYGRGSLAGGYLGMSRSPSALSVKNLDPSRKVKSAVDLVSLVMQEKMSSSVHLTATNV